MSIFNSLEFNSLLFGEGSPTSSSPFNYVNLQTNISGNSQVNSSLKRITTLHTDIDCLSTVEFIRLKQLKGFNPTLFSGKSEVGTFLSKTSRMVTQIDGGSSSRAGTFLYAFDVYSTTTVESGVHVDYVFNDTRFGGSSLFSSKPSVDYRVSSDISGKSIVVPTAQIEKLFSTNTMAGSSTVSISGLDVFTRLFLDSDGIIGNSSFSASMSKSIKLTPNVIHSKTTFNRARMSVNYGGFGPTIFSGNSDFKSVKKLGELDKISGRTRIEASLTAPESLKNIGSRRRISFVFEVDKPDTKSSIIDQHYKILKFYNSLSSLPETLEYVKRNAQREISGYDLDSTSHRSWSNGTYLREGDLYNIKTGERGIVHRNATGLFLGRDGQFGIYTGPTIVNGDLS